jgi:hypothetical protein
MVKRTFKKDECRLVGVAFCKSEAAEKAKKLRAKGYKIRTIKKGNSYSLIAE